MPFFRQKLESFFDGGSKKVRDFGRQSGILQKPLGIAKIFQVIFGYTHGQASEI
jgi:hypothetical protein